MSTKRKRRTYTPEFKKDAIDLVAKNEYSCNEAARRLGIGSSMLARWLRESRDDEAALEAGHPTTKQLKDEIRLLKAENKRLEMEREILKKAAAFFAKEVN
ncbi:transposase [Desulfoluna spongiiphila]|uniref:Transposase n=1 Tax=Desulfoluna spongiiphila TaxID=419481 RepID=A0A1G5FH12_9BACT|nr:transposase [Desulfoluna spongiiphila]SCY38572.1 transposase [Desulfoluna spongiiphila]VVS92157.1 hypothetical protein DBB_17250 [Desulfoluna spongiiphila]VVS94886.1 hypothetical protein DBB_44630 [Desulfoluna spongiiphila]VVS95295.1 hypothetical protein DBB_48720 [Desulfoluna spongiiphila]VVS95299.1 hypothetical protein DBB_48760 [Desulfoluna spongiiphila]